MNSDDFNMVYTDLNGQFIKIEELNKMIEYGVITINKEKLDKYKFNTCFNYNKEKYTEDEAFKMYIEYFR